jgi:hypothetical protein
MRKFYLFIFLIAMLACNRMPIAESVKTEPVGCDALADEPIDNLIDQRLGYCVETSLDIDTWKTFLQKNLVPDSLMIDSIPVGTYKVVIQFELERDGTVSNASLVTDPGHGLGQYALNVVRRYKEKAYDYPALKSYRRQPITFVFEDEDEACDEERQEFFL